MIYFDSLIQTFDFGKFKGCDLGEVLMFAPDYIRWVTENIEGEKCAFSENAIFQIKEVFPYINLSDDLLEKMKSRREEHFEYDYLTTVTIEEIQQAEQTERDYEMEKNQEEDSYERYNGSYAQDEMGYSDDDIDTIFDGDPSAYWNID